MVLEFFPGPFSICKLLADTPVDISRPFTFLSVTDSERSLVCPSADVPKGVIAREDDFFLLRISGTLDFSLIGILAKLSTCLADAGVGIFAISTFDTDYILTKNENYKKATEALISAGYEIKA